MAEVEHFVDPGDKRHTKFAAVRDTPMWLYSACAQMDGAPARLATIGEAVGEGLVANETLGYYMARILSYLLMCGVSAEGVRFRQHMSQEMAHYARDCWDAECRTSYGWVECVGCADRAAYDLTQHTKATGVRLVAEKTLAQPKTVSVVECQPVKGVLGKKYKADAKRVMERLAGLSPQEVDLLEARLGGPDGEGEVTLDDGSQWSIAPDMVNIKRYSKQVHVEELVPSVIEPSFGIGRIMYAVLEHTFQVRPGGPGADDQQQQQQRTYFTLPPRVAPVKCAVLPLSGRPEFAQHVRALGEGLRARGVAHRVDDASSSSLGRRYARTDEVAVPYAITIDFDTLREAAEVEEGGGVAVTATLRDRDTMTQIRAPMSELPGVVSDLAEGRRQWADVARAYPRFLQQEATSGSGNAVPTDDK